MLISSIYATSNPQMSTPITNNPYGYPLHYYINYTTYLQIYSYSSSLST